MMHAWCKNIFYRLRESVKMLWVFFVFFFIYMSLKCLYSIIPTCLLEDAFDSCLL